MTDKTELVNIVSRGIVTLWKSYKQSNRQRFEDPSETFIRSLFGMEANDAKAAACLVQDVAKAVDTVRTNRKFKSMIDAEF